MPQTHSAEKALRGANRRRVLNDRWRRKIREVLKAVREARATAKKEALVEAIDNAESVLDKAAQRNIIHWRQAARRKARLRASVKAK